MTVPACSHAGVQDALSLISTNETQQYYLFSKNLETTLHEWHDSCIYVL